jgi:hypothetical protein
MSYPITLEIWSAFQTTLQTNAKRLCDDIAHAHGKDSKELWNSVKGQISVGLVDIEVDEELPKLCDYPLSTTDGAVKLRCRAPCLLGFPSCPNHIHKQIPTVDPDIPVVDRVFDHCYRTYYVDAKGVARDKNGSVKGIVKEDCIYLFEKAEDPSSENT